MRFEGWPIVGWCSAALLAMCAGLLASGGADEAGVRLVIRATARTSVALFLLAFVASGLRRIWRRPLSAWLLRNRRQMGVSFAVSHGIHLVAVVALATVWTESFESTVARTTVAAGIVAYPLIFAQAATSSDRAIAWLGRRRWSRLHRVGIWVVWGIFAFSYVPAGFEAPVFAPLGLALLGAAGLRYRIWSKGRASRSSVAA